MKVCKYCHTECDETTKKCPSCGSNDFNHKCANCGTEHSSAFCPNCGIKFDAKKHVCPTCGNSFYTNVCPTCGYTIKKSTFKENSSSNTMSSTVYISTKPKKKKNIWITILLWLFFFPIMAFVAIWKSKMSQKTKIILTAIFAVVFIVMGLGGSNDNETTTNTNKTEQNTTDISISQNNSSQIQIETENEAETAPSYIYFPSDNIVNNFFINYNEIATIKIPTEMIEQGNIKTKALVYGEGFNIEVINSQQGTLSVSIGSNPESEDTTMFEIFRDCVKAKTVITDDEIKEVWDYLHESGYMVEGYEYKGITITYVPSVELSWGVNDPRIDLLF